MPRIIRTIILASVLLSSQATAQWDGDPNHMPRWQPQIPQYHLAPSSRAEVVENELIMNQMIAGGAIANHGRRYARRATPEETEADAQQCETIRNVMGVFTFGVMFLLPNECRR